MAWSLVYTASAAGAIRRLIWLFDGVSMPLLRNSARSLTVASRCNSHSEVFGAGERQIAESSIA